MSGFHRDVRKGATYANENWSEAGREAIEEIDTPTSSCFKCKKQDVCVLLRSEIQMLQTYFGHIEDKKDWPNLPEDRARFCKFYLPMHWQEIAR